jgi:hypothetical protein
MGTPEFYASRSPFRNGYFLWSLVLLTIACSGAVGIVMLEWTRLSIWAISLIVYSLIESIFLFRIVLRSQQALHLLLTGGLLQRTEADSTLNTVLGVAADVSNWALVLAFSSTAALLMALIAVIIGH